MNTKIIFKIYSAYQWKEEDMDHKIKKNSYTVNAINDLINQVKSRTKDFPVEIRYNRLRATAGAFILDGIRERIIKSHAVIFDITGFNPNVMFELGVAMEASKDAGNGAKVYIICEGKDYTKAKIPSDLAGYFVSLYEIKGNKAVFHDSNSLAMRLVSDIADLANLAYIEKQDDIT
jgi:hypothetical protein